MKVSLLTKYLITYAILAVLMLLVVSTLGRQLVLNELILHKARELYSEATNIAESQSGRYFESDAVLSDLYDTLTLVAYANQYGKPACDSKLRLSSLRTQVLRGKYFLQSV